MFRPRTQAEFLSDIERIQKSPEMQEMIIRKIGDTIIAIEEHNEKIRERNRQRQEAADAARLAKKPKLEIEFNEDRNRWEAENVNAKQWESLKAAGWMWDAKNQSRYAPTDDIALAGLELAK